MAQVTASMVKELREMTGAGMMDCKKALAATDGDMDKAIEFLRENGMAKAAKKAGRIAAEGIVKTVIDGKKAAIVEVNSETDFVAKNSDFNAYVDAVVAQALTTTAADIDAFLAEPWAKEPSKTVADELKSQIAVIGENLNIRRFAQIDAADGCVVSYIHGGGKIGVLVEAKTDVINDNVTEALRNIAMQIAALNPTYVSADQVSEEFKAHEKEILLAQIANDPSFACKPEKVIEGTVNGRLNKELKEICLLDQTYVKAADGKQSVSAYLAEVAKAENANLSIKQFIRFETGEGIEKKNEDFAAEVAAQLSGN